MLLLRRVGFHVHRAHGLDEHVSVVGRLLDRRDEKLESDPTEEERKGGSGKIGKTIFSMTDDKLNVVAYVPEEHTAKCNAVEWLQNTVTEILKGGNDRVGDASAVAKELVTSAEGKESTFAMASINRDGDKALFPLKMKDACINAGYAYLKERGLFPDGDSDDEDDYVFGDDDFPSM